MSSYARLRRKYFRELRLPNDIVQHISDCRKIRNRKNLSPMRSVVFTICWNEGSGFNAKVLGDDLSDIPIITDVNVRDDEIRDTQEFMLFCWMIEKNMNDFVDNLIGRSLILSFAKKGQNVFTESDIMVFYDFGVFDSVKINNIKRFFGKTNLEK